MKRLLLQLLIRDDGPTAVEYCVLLALIVAVCIGAVKSMANSTAASFENSATQLTSVFGS